MGSERRGVAVRWVGVAESESALSNVRGPKAKRGPRSGGACEGCTTGEADCGVGPRDVCAGGRARGALGAAGGKCCVDFGVLFFCFA